MKAHEIMSTPVVCVAPDDAVKAAARTMVLHRVSGLPVIDAEQKLVGIISESDLLHRAELETDVRPKWWLVSFGDTDKCARSFAKSHGTLVRDVMSGAVICVQAEAPLAEVARVLDDNKGGPKQHDQLTAIDRQIYITEGPYLHVPATVGFAEALRLEDWVGHVDLVVRDRNRSSSKRAWL